MGGKGGAPGSAAGANQVPQVRKAQKTTSFCIKSACTFQHPKIIDLWLRCVVNLLGTRCAVGAVTVGPLAWRAVEAGVPGASGEGAGACGFQTPALDPHHVRPYLAVPA